MEALDNIRQCFGADTKISKLLSSEEKLGNVDNINLTNAIEQQKLHNIIKLTSLFTGEAYYVFSSLSDKLFELSNWNKPEMTVHQAIKLMKTHLDGNELEPLIKFFKDIRFPEHITDTKNWYNLVLKNKKAGAVLFPELKDAPKNYDQGLEKLAEIFFPRFQEIETLDDNKLSQNVTKAKLKDFTKKVIEFNALGNEENQQITAESYNEALDILIDPNLKSTDKWNNSAK